MCRLFQDSVSTSTHDDCLSAALEASPLSLISDQTAVADSYFLGTKQGWGGSVMCY